MERLEFERRLRDASLSPQAMYIISEQRERIVELQKQVDLQADATLMLARTIEGFVKLNEAMEQKLELVSRGSAPFGIDVSSVASEPEN